MNTGIVQLGSLTFCGYEDVDNIKKPNLLVSLNSVEYISTINTQIICTLH